ncbi:hypothetical protein [Dehalogenimonas alkenigignens]|uniref:Uncharacterized protein n=1 Tax=Dehalogenimonas alkenigignens TaxID=1217799 RepID=A0A0W0GKT0_9CHLR|nr:hypothetical protein [Dehalogenimonas alkenigignens]KTB49168.1 hypothetical protein DEALK_00800 [Dehalogenimonas alkenigignens]PVV83680.1 hypothetical protein DD509_05450 [Dehalogenimonas alkenigignens]
MPDYFFPDYVKQATHRRVDGRCECTTCGSHAGKRCDTLYWSYHDAYYVPINPKEPPEMHNCKLLCKRCWRQAEAAR